ncbi:MAG: helix-turn-helix domain-containing protein [Oscillospiraceae bacterium]|jgi:transcriptional regulator with XRE-family HTH domain|nr:helix-turn-helix domain-containing protein [Oscillospiraceae bacterium]
MNSEKMGQFIAELRKSRQMTQKDLAERLNVSDKAVSKWERGLSCPDIALLSPLSEVLGITATELLNGERAGAEAVDVEAVVVNALEYGSKTAKWKAALNQSIIAAAFSVLLLVGIFVVSVVNVAVSGAFTWSPIPIIASVYLWLVSFPAIKWGVKGIVASLTAASVFILPFLYAMDYTIDRLLGSDSMVFSIGIRIAPLSVVFIWIAYFLFKKLKTRILLAIAILVLLSSPVSYVTNTRIADALDKPYNSIEIILNTFTPVIVAAILFIIEFALRKRTHYK